MTSIIKFVMGLVGLVVVVIVAAVVFVATLDPNEHKDWLSEQAKNHTGRDLQLNGDIKLTYYPWLGVETNQLVLANAAGFGDQPFFKADHLNLRIKLMPLLRDQYEIDTVSIHGAEINLAKNAEGATNWDDLVSTEEQQDQAAFPVAAVVLGGVDIKDARVSWKDASNEAEYSLENINITTDALTFGEPLKLHLDMDAKSKIPEIDSSVKLDGTIAYDIDNQRYQIQPLELGANIRSENIPGGETTARLAAAIEIDLESDTAKISDLALDALGTQINGNFTAGRIQSPGPSIQAGLTVKGEDLALLFKLAEIEELAAEVSKLADRQFTLETSIDADMERGDVHISDLSMAMLGATVKGDVKTTNILSETPGYKGNLNAAGPDLPTLLKVLGQFSGGSDSALTQYGLTLSNNKHKSFKIDADFDADMKGGDVDVSKLDVAMLGASVVGKVKARDLLSETPGYQGTLKAKGPDLPTLLQLIGQAQGGNKSTLAVYGKKLRKVKAKAFNIDAGFDADMKSGNVQVPTLSINTLGVKVAGNLNAKNMTTDGGNVTGKLEVNADNLGPLLRAIDQKAAAKSLHALNLKTGISGNADRVELKGLALKATVTGEQVGKESLDLSLSANTSLNLPKQTLAMDQLTLKGLGLDVSGDILAKKILKKNPELSGTIDLAPVNLRTLARKLKQKLPKTADKKVLRRAALKTRFQASAKNVELEDMTLRLDDTRMKGSFAINNLENSAYVFDLNVDNMNLDRYLPPEEKGKENAPITPETAAGAVVQLPVDTLRAINARGSLSFGELTVSRAKLTEVSMSLDAKDGRIKLSPIAAKLYRGTYKGNIDIDARANLPKVVVDSALKAVNIERLLRDITGKKAMIVGRSNVSIAAVARGNNTDMFKKTLAGQVELKVTKGVYRGLDVDRALESVETMIETKRFSKNVDTAGDTAFDRLTATSTINKGIVTNDDLLLTSANFSVKGKGMLANLRNMTWKYDPLVVVPERSIKRDGKTFNIGGYNIPIKCRGKISGENCKVDPDFYVTVLKKIFFEEGGIPGLGTAKDKAIDPGKQLLDSLLKGIGN